MDYLNEQKKKVQDSVKKVKNKDFMEGVVAACALVAYADGVIEPQEKAKMMRYIQQNDALSLFEMTDIIKAFEKHVQQLDFDIHIGKGEALKIISKLKKKPEEAKMMVWVSSAIGAADGNFDDTEKEVVREICRTLDLDPKEFQL